MSPPGRRRERLQALKRQASTKSTDRFYEMARNFDRLTIVAEGDSWFAYPKKWLVFGPPNNLIDYIEKKTKRKANLLRCEAVGDEAVEMMSGEQRRGLCKILDRCFNRENYRSVDLLLFSGGGNDVAGEYCLDQLLKPDASGAANARGCFVEEILDSKIQQMELAYRELVIVRDRYSPETVIATHTYDYPFPTGKGWGLGIGPWLKPHLDDAKVPEALKEPVCVFLIDQFAEMLARVKQDADRFIVVNTCGTLGPEPRRWDNELHPTSRAFRALANAFYDGIKEADEAEGLGLDLP